jgi:hypothetical protein
MLGWLAGRAWNMKYQKINNILCIYFVDLYEGKNFLYVKIFKYVN